MSATDNTTRAAAAFPTLRASILSTAAALAVLAGMPHAGAAQGLDRLFNRAAEVQGQSQEAEVVAPTQDAPDDTWGLEVTGDTDAEVEPSPLTLEEVAPTTGMDDTSALVAVPAATPDNPLRTQLEAEIDARMRAIAERIGQTPPPPSEGTLSVEELDALQRNAQRAAASQSLQDAEYQGIRAEIEMLLYLQNTLTEMQEARGTPAPQAAQGEQAAAQQPAVDVAALRAQWEAEKAAEAATQAQEQANATLAAEQAAIPRLAAVKGAAGQWEAEIESVRGVMQFVAPGDALADGFIVESIDGKGAIIKAAATGNRYSLIPSPPGAVDSAPTASAGQPAMARDLSQSGGVF